MRKFVNNKSQDKIRNSKVNLKCYKKENEIIVEEGDQIPSEDSDGDLPISKPISKKNHLCKTLIDQCKELCYQQSLVYKDFDSIYIKVYSRLKQWELFEDEEINMAGQALKIIANSGQLVNLVADSNISKLFGLYENEENQPQVR